MTTAKKTPARPAKKTTPARRDTPAGVGFNFDTWDRGDQIEPFAIVIAGKRYESGDPVEMDFRALLAGMRDPERMFRELFPEDHEEILENNIPVGAVAAFSEACTEHFRLGDFVESQS